MIQLLFLYNKSEKCSIKQYILSDLIYGKLNMVGKVSIYALLSEL